MQTPNNLDSDNSNQFEASKQTIENKLKAIEAKHGCFSDE